MWVCVINKTLEYCAAWQAESSDAGKGSGGSQGHETDDYLLFCEGFLKSDSHKLPAPGTKEWNDAISPPIISTD